jgi:hypothetical protein
MNDCNSYLTFFLFMRDWPSLAADYCKLAIYDLVPIKLSLKENKVF